MDIKRKGEGEREGCLKSEVGEERDRKRVGDMERLRESDGPEGKRYNEGEREKEIEIDIEGA